MDGTEVVVSASPDDLHQVADISAGIELTFDWEHTRLLTGERDLGSLLEKEAINPERIHSIHLPPGTVTRGDDIGMAITESNRGTIIDFVFSQLSAIPDAYLVAHPPKEADIPKLLELISDIGSITGRDIAVENTSAVSDWHNPAQLSYYAVAAEEYDRLERLYLTIDSAHLPRYRDNNTTALIEQASRIHRRSTKSQFSIADFPEKFEQRLDRTHQWLLNKLDDEDKASTAFADPYYPLVISLAHVGPRVRGIHFNDPVTDDIPEVRDITISPLNEAIRSSIRDCGRDSGTSVVLKRSDLSGPEFRTRLEDIKDWLVNG